MKHADCTNTSPLGAELDEVDFDRMAALQDSVDCESLVYPHDQR